MKITNIEINAEDMRDPKEVAGAIKEAIGPEGASIPVEAILKDIVINAEMNTILKMEIAIEDYGVNINAGGSSVACEVMCDTYDGFEELLNETKQKISEVCKFFSEGMEELKHRKEEKENADGNDL